MEIPVGKSPSRMFADRDRKSTMSLRRKNARSASACLTPYQRQFSPGEDDVSFGQQGARLGYRFSCAGHHFD
jgi:hypothetical protein